jgi:hypothetical protein
MFVRVRVFGGTWCDVVGVVVWWSSLNGFVNCVIVSQAMHGVIMQHHPHTPFRM